MKLCTDAYFDAMLCLKLNWNLERNRFTLKFMKLWVAGFMKGSNPVHAFCINSTRLLRFGNTVDPRFNKHSF